MFCTNCGNKLAANATFCAECGNSMSDSGRSKFQESTQDSHKKSWYKFFRLIYPKVKQDKAWHRLVFVFGWLVSIVSLVWFPITFAVYFGVIQRGIYFIVYGEDKSKWLIKD
jgi:uncharacterized membrane protein YvbJ